MSLKEFLNYAQKNQFKGLHIQKDYLWKEVEGIKFYSYTIEGCKFSSDGMSIDKNYFFATYAGPFDSVFFEGTKFQLGETVVIAKETAAIISSYSYKDQFIITDSTIEKPKKDNSEISCCS